MVILGIIGERSCGVHRGRHAKFLGGPNIYGPHCQLHHFWHTTI